MNPEIIAFVEITFIVLLYLFVFVALIKFFDND